MVSKVVAIEDLRGDLKQIQQQIWATREERSGLIEEIRDRRAKRRELISQIKKNRSSARELIDKKRSSQAQYADLREKRKEILDKFEEAKDLAAKLKKENEEVLSSVPLSERELRRRIGGLERRIETGSVSMDQERDFVMRIGYYEAMLKEHSRAKELRRQHLSAAAETEKWKFFLRESAHQLRETGTKIGELKEGIGKLIAGLDELGKSVDEANEEIRLRSKKVDELREQLNSLFEKLHEIREKIRKMAQEREKGVYEQMAERAKVKLKKGEKMDMEELLALVKTGELYEEKSEAGSR